MTSLSLVSKPQPHVLTIAGSDSGGGAGIQADLKTISAFGCYGSSVITGLTAQNTLGVQDVYPVPTDFVIKQLKSIFDDIPPTHLKFGMLTSAETIKALAIFFSALPESQRPQMVLDPVMVSTSGHTLLPDDAVAAIKEDLVPLIHMLTPNIPEAMRLVDSSTKVNTLADMLKLIATLTDEIDLPSVLLKGGHLAVTRDQIAAYKGRIEIEWDEGDDEEETVEVLDGFREVAGVKKTTEYVVDILHQGWKGANSLKLFVGKRLDSTSTHGTGCTLSAAIACAWATGPSGNARYEDGARRGIAFTQSAIASAYSLGGGNGPLNHSHLTMPRALPSPTVSNPHPFTSYLIRSDISLWKSYVRHPFVVELGKGTLPRECFEHYIKQDYHYLRHYARAHSLGAYKSSHFDDIKAFSEIALHIARESEMHVAYCAEFGITRETLIETPESASAAAYARYILDIGTQGDILDLYVAVASCLIGYGEVGLWLQRRVESGEAKLDGNLYKRWMEDYSSKDFLDAVNRGIENLERRIALDPPSPIRLAQLTKIWQECVRLERDFWQMGLDLSA